MKTLVEDLKIMRYKELKSKEVIDFINEGKLSPVCSFMWRTIFLSIEPHSEESRFPLKDNYKKPNEFGLYSEILANQLKKDNEIQFARDKINKNSLYGDYYDNQEASLKLHININGIGEVDQEIIRGLMTLLIDQSQVEDNNLRYQFKLVQPEYTEDKRFKNTDQVTIYLDKYSSVESVMNLSEKINEYLKKQGLHNSITLGPKDSFGFNEFVSARFDTNKLLAQYAVFKFFDIEIGKFLYSREKESLRNIPLCAFEAVFYYCLLDPNIDLNGQEALSPEMSAKVQEQFNIMAQDPKKYLTGGAYKKEQALLEKITEAIKKRGINYILFQLAYFCSTNDTAVIPRDHGLREFIKENNISGVDIRQLLSTSNYKDQFKEQNIYYEIFNKIPLENSTDTLKALASFCENVNKIDAISNIKDNELKTLLIDVMVKPQNLKIAMLNNLEGTEKSNFEIYLKELAEREQARRVQEEQARRERTSLETAQEKQRNEINKIGIILSKLDKILLDFLKKTETIGNNFSEASNKSKELYNSLLEARNEYETDLRSGNFDTFSHFKNKCSAAIQEALPTLERDLGWGDYLKNMLKKIANVVIYIGTLSMVHGLFKQTKSESSQAAIKLNEDLQLGEQEETKPEM